MNTFKLVFLLVSMVLNQSVLAQAISDKNPGLEQLQIINTPQCAADMAKPTDSVFITATLRNTGIVLNNIAKTTKRNQLEFVGQGLKFYKSKLIYLTNSILNGLNSGNLKLITSKEEALVNLVNLNKSFEKANIFHHFLCSQVNEINNKYAHLFIRGLNKDTLGELAKQYINKTTQTDCRFENIKADLDLYPVYNFELRGLTSNKNWNKKGFEFWQSFKIYLSAAWRTADVSALQDASLNNLTLMVPMEEEVLILSNGCKSIERPECNSSFLSTAELRNLFTTEREKLEMTSSSVEMKDLITDNTDKTDNNIKRQQAEKSADKQWIADFHRSYAGFASKNIENLFKTNKLFSSAVTQKTIEGLSNDLETEFVRPEMKEEAYYMCAEHRLLTQEQPLNLMKIDLENLEKNNGFLDQYLIYGMTVNDIIKTHQTLSKQMTKLCDKFDNQLAGDENNLWQGYFPWYKSFLSRYKIINAQIDQERENIEKLEIIQPIKAQNYINKLCSSAIDCHRKMTEGIVQLNKLVIHSRVFFRNQIQSSPVFNERSEKVACGIYDPFEVSRLNRRKLLSDIGSSILFGWTTLPIYLDINYKPKELVSFQKLVKDGQVKFDLEFKQKTQETLSLNLGSFMNVPCSISISNGGADMPAQGSNLIFSGLSVNACKGTKKGTIENTTSNVDDFRKSEKVNLQGCVECALNFRQISTLGFLNTFAPVRSLIRIIEGVVRYSNVRSNDVINPRTYSINPDYLMDTYKEYGEIPEGCVNILAKGLSCSPSLCEALAKKEFQNKTGLVADTVTLIAKKGRADKFKRAIFTSSKCSKPIETSISCLSNGSSFRLSVSNSDVSECEKD